MPSLTAHFRPAVGLSNPHLQTLWGPLWRRLPELARSRERLWLTDGDFIDLDWHGPHQPDAPLVLVLHGLTGSSQSPYVKGLQQALPHADVSAWRAGAPQADHALVWAPPQQFIDEQAGLRT